MKFIFTPIAINSLEEITDFLKQNWTQKELTVLKDDIKKFKIIINESIVKHPSVKNLPKIKYTFIGKKQVKLFYEIIEDSVVVKLFWHCKRDPEKMENLLKGKKI